MESTNRVPAGVSSETIAFMLRDDVGTLAEAYATWLQQDRTCKFSTIANYLNGLVSITNYCYANLAPDDAVFNSDPNPLSQLINLRSQAEKASKTQNLFEQRVGSGWIPWDEVQKARVAALDKVGEAEWIGAEDKRAALRDACAISLLSLIPPDR